MVRRAGVSLALSCAGALLLLASAPGATGRATSCRVSEVRVNDEAVFGHFSTASAAQALAARAIKLGFKGVKIESDGCGDFEAEIDGAPENARVSFATEAEGEGFEITYEQTADPLAQDTRYVYGVLGTFKTVAAADRLAHELARDGFRYIDVAYRGGRWLAVMPQVPIKAALPIAREVSQAGFHIAFGA